MTPYEVAETDGQATVRMWGNRATKGDVRACYNLAFLYCTGLWASPGGATPEERRQAASDGREQALEWLHRAAADGHAAAQYVLGLLCTVRAGRFLRLRPRTEANSLEAQAADREATVWFERAARTGHIPAQVALANIYSAGESHMWNRALELYHGAAGRGNASAQYALGRLYIMGRGTPKNLDLAARYYRSAAEISPVVGLESPTAALAYLYATGSGVSLDYSEAARLYQKAASAYRQRAEDEYNLKSYEHRHYFVDFAGTEALAWICEAARDGWPLAKVAINTMHEQAIRSVSADERRSLAGEFWITAIADDGDILAQLRNAASRGDAKAQFVMALVDWGFDGSASPSATEWLTTAATQQLVPAARLLGDMFQDGQGVDTDVLQANRYYRLAADAGDATAQYEIGRSFGICYPYGGQGEVAFSNTEKRICTTTREDQIIATEAATWYTKAANQGHSQAQLQLAYLHLSGRGVTEDAIVALELLRNAAAQGNANAQYFLAQCYDSGIGLPMGRPDHAGAAKLYGEAARQGHKHAGYELRFDYNADPLLEDGSIIFEWLRDADG